MLDLMVTNVREQIRDIKIGGSLVELVEFTVLKNMSQVRIKDLVPELQERKLPSL